MKVKMRDGLAYMTKPKDKFDRMVLDAFPFLSEPHTYPKKKDRKGRRIRRRREQQFRRQQKIYMQLYSYPVPNDGVIAGGRGITHHSHNLITLGRPVNRIPITADPNHPEVKAVIMKSRDTTRGFSLLWSREHDSE